MTKTVKKDSVYLNEDWRFNKNGKTTIKADLTEGQGDVHDSNITIEGKDGIMIIIVEFKDHPEMKIKAYVSKYEEKG